MQDPTRDSRSSLKCPSCEKSLYYSSTRCSDCGWQAWHSRPEFLWLMVALVLGGMFVFGLSRQNTNFTTATERHGERQSH